MPLGELPLCRHGRPECVCHACGAPGTPGTPGTPDLSSYLGPAAIKEINRLSDLNARRRMRLDRYADALRETYRLFNEVTSAHQSTFSGGYAISTRTVDEMRLLMSKIHMILSGDFGDDENDLLTDLLNLRRDLRKEDP